MRETRAQKHLKDVLPSGAIFTRVENAVGVGMFDLNVICPNGYEFWLEMKQVDEKVNQSPTSVYKIDLRATQSAWAIQRIRNGAKNLYAGLMIGGTLYIVHLFTTEDVRRCRDGLTLYELRLKNAHSQSRLNSCSHLAMGSI
jgi:hypothetical protein